jgi:hypothetical protein
LKRITFCLIAIAIVVGAGTVGYNRLYVTNSTAATAKFRTVAVARGEVQQVVNSPAA